MRYFVFLALLFPFFVSANEYFWRINTGATGNSPRAACQHQVDNQIAMGDNRNGIITSLDRVTYVQYTCSFTYESYVPSHDRWNKYTSGPFIINRFGSLCPPGTFLDLTVTDGSNQCKSLDPCGELFGQEVEWDSSDIDLSVCMPNKCMVALTDSAFSASNKRQAYKTDVSSDVLFRNAGIYTGESCSAPSRAPADTPPPTPTESSTSNSCTGTVTDAEGRQHSSCEDTDIFKDQRSCVQSGGALGTSDFGQGSMLTCVQSKGPTATQTTTQTQKTVEPTANGGTKTTTTTTTTTKNCVGTNACTTKNTTNTHTSVTNGNGTPGGQSSSCKGDDCKGSSTGTKPGDGEDKGEEDEEEGIPGPTKVLAKGEQGSLQDAFSEWDEKIETARAELDEKIAQYSDLFAGVFDLNLGSASGSLPCQQVPVSFGTSRTTLDMCLDDFNEPLGYIRYAILLAAAALAALIILR